MSEMVSLNKDSLKQWQEQNLEHLRYEYDLLPEDFVLDIGSYQREWGKEIVNRYGCKVFYFEALDDRAAWIYDGEIELGGAFYYSSQFLPPVVKVKCVDIARYLDKEIRLVKINIEGGEYQLLDYIIEKDLIGNIAELQVQFHLIEGADSEKEYYLLAKRLSMTHKLTWRYPFVWENWTRKKTSC